MKNQLLIFFVFIFSFTSCEVENDALDTKQMTSQIPEWVKEQATSEELQILESLITTHKIHFSKLNNDEKGLYPRLLDLYEESGVIIQSQDLVRVKTRTEGGDWSGGGSDGEQTDNQEGLGHCDVTLYDNRILGVGLKVIVTFAYKYKGKKLTEISSSNVTMNAQVGFPVYWVEKVNHFEIENDNVIHYQVEGYLRQKGEVGSAVAEIDVAYINKDDRVRPQELQ